MIEQIVPFFTAKLTGWTMYIRKILLIVFLALSMPLSGQQLDKPVGSEDLVDQKSAAENSYAAETSRIDDPALIWSGKSGANSTSPQDNCARIVPEDVGCGDLSDSGDCRICKLRISRSG